ncbi:MAG: cation:proton antiporter subunit C [Verrucomicrobiales bacterium]|nr:cation:proton antiporter subunit C [Verrucomicrobiales bacterium]
MTEIDHRVYLAASAIVFVIGFYSLLVQAHVLRRIMALNVMGSGVFLFLIALGSQTPGPVPDPVPRAMVLTGIVVSVCATGLALALADRVQDTTDRCEISEANRHTASSDRKSGIEAEHSEGSAS